MNSSDEETDVPSIKSKGVNIKERTLIIPKKSRYSEESKGKEFSCASEKEVTKLLKKHMKQV